MKRLFISLLILCLVLSGCVVQSPQAQIAASTLPVYEFTARLCQGTGITVTRLITESVSCLHDYTLQVGQMRAIEAAEVVVLSGAGLEEYLEDALTGVDSIIDASEGIGLLCPEEDHDHEEHEAHGHHHEFDPHIWLSPVCAAQMAQNICNGLIARYPAYTDAFQTNLESLLADLEALDCYGKEQFQSLSSRDIITFHDGFSYFAQEYDLHILRAVEEESGSEASAAELIALIELVREHGVPALFVEKNGSDAAARTISAETGIPVYTLDMAMAGNSYFDAMYHNINTIKEALG